MDEILYLDADGEINLVLEKIKALNGKSVVLVIPKSSLLLSSIINLKLLKKETEKLKKRIVLVTQDRTGIRLANHLGIPVYRSIEDDTPVVASEEKVTTDEVIRLDLEQEEINGDINIKHYSQGEQDFVASKHNLEHQVDHQGDTDDANESIGKMQILTPRRVLLTKLTLFIILLAIGAWWLFYFVPHATVNLTLASEPIKETVAIVADNNINQTNITDGHIPGQKIELETKFKDSFVATGQKEVGTKATGEVTISNRLGQVVELPAGTKFSRDNLVFLSKQTVQVGPATVTLDSQGEVSIKSGTAKVGVEAESAGETYNTAAGTLIISSLSGVKREKVTAENKLPMTGGESKVVTILSSDDLEKAKTEIIDKHRQELLEDLKKRAGDLTIVSDSEEISLIEAASNKTIGEETTDFELEATLRAKSIGFSGSDYQQMVLELISQKLPADKELVIAPNDSLQTEITNKEYTQGLLTLLATLESKVVKKFNQDELKKLIVGQSSVAAQTTLTNQIEGIQTVQISLKPSFRSHLPKNVNQIEIVITND